MSKKLYIVPDGGLANRMRAIAAGLSLAKATGRVPMVVWHANALCNVAIDTIFDIEKIPSDIITPGNAEYKLVYDLPRKSNLYLPVVGRTLKFSKCFYDATNLVYYCEHGEELASIVGEQKGDVLVFSGLEYFNFSASDYRRMFVPTEIVERRISEILNGRKPAVACQIRRTDNAQSIHLSPLELFLERMTEWTAENPGRQFYLATDDEEVKALFKDRFGDAVFFNTTPACRSSVEGMIDAMAEMYIMSRCSMIYGSAYSSYAEASAMIGDIDNLQLQR